MPKRLTNFLDRVEKAGLVDEAAVQTILNLADPFPDSALNASGWPMMAGQNTVPMALTDYLNISAPVGVTTTWNFKVAFIPTAGNYNSSQYNNWDRASGQVGTASATATILGQFNVWTWKAEDAEPDWLKVPPNQIITLDPRSSWSLSRICAAGFELINTSTDLYRGGMYYGWRAPSMTSDMNCSLVSNPTATTLSVYKLFSGVPASLSAIINLNTTVVGSARDGIGVFSLPMEAENPLIPSLPMNIFLVNDMNSAACVIRVPANAATTNFYPWMPCGAYVTGLAQQATFQLKSRVFYENVPDAASSTLLQAIARPSVPHSFLAQELMAKMLVHMPCGFDYKENPFGEWFAKVLDALSMAAPIVGQLFPHPVVKTIATAAGPLLAQGATALKAKVAEKKAKALNQAQTIKRPAK